MSNVIPRCIECGGPVNSLNEDDEGVPCPACSERLLESLPGVFHAPWGRPEPADGVAVESEEQESAFESGPDQAAGPRATPGSRRPRGDDFSGDAS